MKMNKPPKEPTEAMIKHMVNRFLMWPLPEHFHPDAGISFTPEFNVEHMAAQGKPPMRHKPIGTNLFGADDAERMVRFMLDGASAMQSATPTPSEEKVVCDKCEGRTIYIGRDVETGAEVEISCLYCNETGFVTAALPTPRDTLVADAEFLCARLRDLEGFDGDELLRQLMGHVLPALARLESALSSHQTQDNQR
jgi:hypothetical protein